VGGEVQGVGTRFFCATQAVEAAIKLANDGGKDGKPAVVLFQKTKTDFQKVWTYGESAYPPSKLALRIGSAAPQSKEAVRVSARPSHSPPGELQSEKEPA
jgi:hypothetical protein